MSALDEKFILTSGFLQSLENKLSTASKVQSFNICDLLREKDYKVAFPSSSQTSPNSNQDDISRDSPPHLKKIRKARTIFTDRQLQELEINFQRNKYLTVEERQVLAHRMELSEIQVKTWYQNRRTKWKREQSLWISPTHPLLLFLQQTVIPLQPPC